MTKPQLYKLPCILFVFVFISACSSLSTKKTTRTSLEKDNICFIFKKNPHWYRAVDKAAKEWGVSIPMIMAIIQKESGFKHNARPIAPQKKGRKKKKKYLSSAYGYAQALDGTWKHYCKQTRRRFAQRDRFADCAHFIGWYGAKSRNKCGISKRDAYSHYLAYHEGHTGFNKRTHKKNKTLIRYAQAVAEQTRLFKHQLKQYQHNKSPKMEKNSKKK
ncbi:MAG: transglycosylase SLT domain-containing protein [Candidatus Endonucleobacter bathymodioli]|uniref:Transglycosylase SLT domain-containing protein n=1 Tax=Candidatus Endonucleibacter bathymodioli TaxID=539814 RepID=A0AA90NS49_9GAMM|nr:transglycosylase SLT domain-containing protein [Candidatus Endonucleobacter bathymodioli]